MQTQMRQLHSSLLLATIYYVIMLLLLYGQVVHVHIEVVLTDHMKLPCEIDRCR